MQREKYFLPKKYKENPIRSVDDDSTTFWSGEVSSAELLWQVPVYRFIGDLAKRIAPEIILDIGCGPGYKTTKYLGGLVNKVVGFDQESGIDIAKKKFPDTEWITGNLEDSSDWQKLTNVRPKLISCVDVIEHLRDPERFLKNILTIMTEESIFVLSTPDRNALEGVASLGPPANPRHVREWGSKEMKGFMESLGFEIMETHHLLPRQYVFSMREIARLIWRALHLKALPDKRSCMVVVAKIINK